MAKYRKHTRRHRRRGGDPTGTLVRQDGSRDLLATPPLVRQDGSRDLLGSVKLDPALPPQPTLASLGKQTGRRNLLGTSRRRKRRHTRRR